MKIGDTYLLHRIGSKEWRAWAAEAGLDPLWVGALVQEISGRIADAVAAVRDEVAETPGESIIHTLAEAIRRRAEECVGAMAG